jgi:glycosyltransferase involved in cell wall biosynthesis
MEQCMLLLLQEFRKMNIDAEVLSLNPLGELSNLLEKEKIPAQGLPYRGRGGWRSFVELRHRLKKIEADGLLMIGHNLMASVAIGSRWRQHRAISIHYHHQGVMPDWKWRLIYGVASLQFRAIFFLSDYIMKEALEIAPFLRSRARLGGSLFPLPELPSPEMRENARRRLNLPPHARIVGNAGWLITRKRWDVFLDVAALVLQSEPQTIFLAAGDGPESAALRQKAETLGIAKNVLWLGWQKDLTDFYHAIDLLLFNSDWDALGRTPLEAMSYGIPVVASILHGGAKEIIEDDSIGILLPSHDVAALAQGVLRLLREPEMAIVMGARGRARVDACSNPRGEAIRFLEAMKLPVPSGGIR